MGQAQQGTLTKEITSCSSVGGGRGYRGGHRDEDGHRTQWKQGSSSRIATGKLQRLSQEIRGHPKEGKR